MKIVLALVILLVALIGIVFAVGSRLPVGHRASRTVVLNATPERVWGALTDPSQFTSWRRDVKNVEVQENGKRWVEVDSHDQRITFEVSEARPHERLVTTIADKDLPFGGSWTYELKSVPGRTEVTITENGEVYNALFRFMSRFVFGYTATMEQYLESLKARVES